MWQPLLAHQLAAPSIFPTAEVTPGAVTPRSICAHTLPPCPRPPLPCRQDFWDDLEPQFRQAIDSFKLLETTSAYIPPDQNPWLFF